jgi:hypothetical protein
MEEEVRDILRNAVRAEAGGGVRLGTRLKARFAGIGLGEDIPRIKSEARAAVFKRR